ncbi:hypothetical protein PENARI_c047G00264 [Penicillium arizonense]|uniref:Uncharacterized protein n=1 Tax=Penicillium arizonense TaxID=1835702 RepID=A0A1F5L2T6_PENAI|nr:hypothetical protein PENARI_c047G00264 [Penicillium arizonense]OGE47366.1 hypothetical protein PENARI_c047G00264 [Penicillium arizonense]
MGAALSAPSLEENTGRKGKRRQRPISKRAAELHQIAARRTRHRQQRIWAVLPASPPPLHLRELDPQVRRILRQMQQLEIARRHTSADSSTAEDGPQHLPSRVCNNPDSLAKHQNPPPTSSLASRPMGRKPFGRSIGISLGQMFGAPGTVNNRRFSASTGLLSQPIGLAFTFRIAAGLHLAGQSFAPRPGSGPRRPYQLYLGRMFTSTDDHKTVHR